MYTAGKTSTRSISSLVQMVWIKFLLQYRRTKLGALWLIITPIIFIVLVGMLFSNVGNRSLNLFIPHFAIGYISWTFIGGTVTKSANVFVRQKAHILQTGMSLHEVLFMDILETLLLFTHQAVLIVPILIYYTQPLPPNILLALLGFILIVLNGYMFCITAGLLGARYRDLPELIAAFMRIAFFITPIIWMPGEGGKGGFLGTYLMYNPFYHFLEIFRAPLMGLPVDMSTWLIVLGLTIVNFCAAAFFYKKLKSILPIWI